MFVGEGMSEKRARMFNKRAAKPKYKADKIMEILSLKPSEVVADIGSGGGYYVFRFAKAVGSLGCVYAVDTNQELLAYITKHASEQGMTNIVPLFVGSTFPELPEQKVDLVFMRNVTHHIPNRVDYFKHIRKNMKTGGRLAIIEYDGRGGFFSFQRLHRHFVPLNVLKDELKQAGFVVQNSNDFLSEQSFTIFSLK